MTREEIVRDIVGYEGLYYVDIFGNIYNSKGLKMKQRENEFGYLDIGLSKNNKQSRFKVHRLVVQAFLPNPNNLPQVNHIDGNKKNNNVENLEWVTAKDNTKHAIETKLRVDKLRDLTGQRFGRLTVIEYIGKERKSGQTRNLWRCKCDCGNEKITTDNSLIVGHVKTCGCRKRNKNEK